MAPLSKSARPGDVLVGIRGDGFAVAIETEQSSFEEREYDWKAMGREVQLMPLEEAKRRVQAFLDQPGSQRDSYSCPRRTGSAVRRRARSAAARRCEAERRTPCQSPVGGTIFRASSRLIWSDLTPCDKSRAWPLLAGRGRSVPDSGAQRMLFALRRLLPRRERAPKLRDGFRTYVLHGDRSWGNAITWSTEPTTEDPHHGVIVGWQQVLPVAGDRLLVAMRSGRWGVWVIENVRPAYDPHDMFHAEVSGAVDYVPDDEAPKTKRADEFIPGPVFSTW